MNQIQITHPSCKLNGANRQFSGTLLDTQESLQSCNRRNLQGSDYTCPKTPQLCLLALDY